MNLVANLDRYEAATGLRRADFFLARTADDSHAGLVRAIAALRSGPGRSDPINIESTETALDKDQSSLTAVNVHGLVDLDSLFTLLMSAAGIGDLRLRPDAAAPQGVRDAARAGHAEPGAPGARRWERRHWSRCCGLVAGMLVGIGMGYLLMHILRPLFILDPSVTFPTGDVATLAVLALAATLASALTAIVDAAPPQPDRGVAGAVVRS